MIRRCFLWPIFICLHPVPVGFPDDGDVARVCSTSERPCLSVSRLYSWWSGKMSASAGSPVDPVRTGAIYRMRRFAPARRRSQAPSTRTAPRHAGVGSPSAQFMARGSMSVMPRGTVQFTAAPHPRHPPMVDPQHAAAAAAGWHSGVHVPGHMVPRGVTSAVPRLHRGPALPGGLRGQFSTPPPPMRPMGVRGARPPMCVRDSSSLIRHDG